MAQQTVPGDAEPLGHECPTCHQDLVGQPGGAVAYCVTETCPERQFGFIRSLHLLVRRDRGSPNPA